MEYIGKNKIVTRECPLILFHSLLNISSKKRAKLVPLNK